MKLICVHLQFNIILHVPPKSKINFIKTHKNQGNHRTNNTFLLIKAGKMLLRQMIEIGLEFLSLPTSVISVSQEVWVVYAALRHWLSASMTF